MIRILNVISQSILSCAVALAALVPLGSAHAVTEKVVYSFQGGAESPFEN
jgi:hypothetical protein